MGKILNLEYGSLNAFYWMSYGVIASFASVFLLGKGYTNTDIGMILAAANVVAVFLQPILADITDRSKKFGLVSMISLVTVVMMTLTFGSFILQQKSLALTVIYVLMVAGNGALQPLVNSLCFKLEESGIHMNFGVCRSGGSLAFSILTMILGSLVEKRGILVIPITGEVTLIMVLVSLVLVSFHFKKACKENNLKIEKNRLAADQPTKEDTYEEINLIQFASKHKMFFVMMMGTLGLYFSNGVLNTFMLQVIQPLGGTSEDMGRILSIMAFLEIPTMVFFEQLNRRFQTKTLLKVAATGFVLKTAVVWLAPTVTIVLFAQTFQLVSFALFLPAMVSFISQSMRKGEAVKGQAMFTTVTNIAYILCSFVGGMLLDAYGAGTLMMVSTALTALGAIIIVLTIEKVRIN